MSEGRPGDGWEGYGACVFGPFGAWIGVFDFTRHELISERTAILDRSVRKAQEEDDYPARLKAYLSPKSVKKEDAGNRAYAAAQDGGPDDATGDADAEGRDLFFECLRRFQLEDAAKVSKKAVKSGALDKEEAEFRTGWMFGVIGQYEKAAEVLSRFARKPEGERGYDACLRLAVIAYYHQGPGTAQTWLTKLASVKELPLEWKRKVEALRLDMRNCDAPPPTRDLLDFGEDRGLTQR